MPVTYSQLWSFELAMPTGCRLKGTYPTKSAGENPWVSAACSLNTPMFWDDWKMTKANLLSGEIATPIAPRPFGLVSDPLIGVVEPASACATSITVAPGSAAATMNWPLGVEAMPFVAPAAGIGWAGCGAG